MGRPSTGAIEANINRLNQELKDIDDYFYQLEEASDRLLHAGMLERKRDDAVRSAVLQLHTAIEDVLTSYITRAVLRVRPEARLKAMRTSRGRGLRRLLHGPRSLGFDLKVSLAIALGLLNSRFAKKLAEINELRNKCSHNWLLKVPVRHGRRPKQKKPPLLSYRGRDLHKVEVLKEFLAEFWGIYAKLFAKYLA